MPAQRRPPELPRVVNEKRNERKRGQQADEVEISRRGERDRSGCRCRVRGGGGRRREPCEATNEVPTGASASAAVCLGYALAVSRPRHHWDRTTLTIGDSVGESHR